MRLLCAIIATTLLAGSAFAATINVPEDYALIQDAINASSDGDVIEIAAGTYYEHEVNTGGRAITIRGDLDKDGSPTVTIDAQGNGTVLMCDSQETNSTRFENLIITGGSASIGGGMYNDESSPTLVDCTFEDNFATDCGGGMYNDGSSPTLEGCTFTENGSELGAGMSNEGSRPTLDECTFEDNFATYSGGGMYNKESSPTLEDCTFQSNTSTRVGGGMVCSGSIDLTIKDCTFQSNTSQSLFGKGGGGMYISGGNQTIVNCAFENNSARNGGAMYLVGSNLTIVDCAFVSNFTYLSDASGGAGGGIYIAPGFGWMILFERCTFENNTAAYKGGGIFNKYSPTLIHCIFRSNTADNTGGGMHNEGVLTEPLLENCTFESNTTLTEGGGMFNTFGAKPQVVACAFTSNTAESGGGMYNMAATISTLEDCLFCGNSNPQLVGSYVDDGGNVIEDECAVDCPGDFTGSGYVDVADLLLVISNWQNPYTVEDLLLVISEWNTACP